MPRPLLPVLAVCALGLVPLAGCGDDGDGGGAASAPGTSAAAPAAPAAPDPGAPSAPSAPGAGGVPEALQPPASVPRTSSGRATDAVSARVIRKWLGALRAGDIGRAARFFALPSKVQNGTPVLTLRSARERVVFNGAFPCGAKATKLERGAGGYTIVEFVLTERKDGDCMGAAGNTARSAIRVVDGHITDWYRLDELTPVPAPEAPGGGLAGGGTVA